MTEARVKAWMTKTGKKTATKMPQLCTFPPTSGLQRECEESPSPMHCLEKSSAGTSRSRPN